MKKTLENETFYFLLLFIFKSTVEYFLLRLNCLREHVTQKLNSFTKTVTVYNLILERMFNINFVGKRLS